MQILRCADYRRMPWKNGQGLTREVAAFPPGSSVADFDWRISIAHVEADGLFSSFPGIDRTIALLAGAGLVLDLPGGAAQTLGPDSAPFRFPGEWIIASHNCAGPTVDLNVMTRRGRYAHRLRRCRLAAGDAFVASTLSALLASEPMVLRGPDSDLALEQHDCLLLAAGEQVRALATAPVLIAELEPAAGMPG